MAAEASPAPVHGHCAPGFEPVGEAFAKSFEKGEVGAAVAACLDGELVVDLWGGWRDAARQRPWERDTLVNTYSTTKGVTALCANRLMDQGRLDPDAPVAETWPEFGRAGKETIPVRWLLCHKAGLPALRRPLPAGARTDWETMTGALAEQEPWWEPGTRHGYHALTFGFLVGEVIRRIDGRSVGTYLREEIAGPLGLDFHIGLPEALDARCADMLPPPRARGGASSPLDAAAQDPESLLGLTFSNPPSPPGEANSAAWRRAEIPAGNGHGDARSLARLYGALAGDGTLDGLRLLSPAARDRATTEEAFGPDEVLKPLQTRFGLGFMLTQPMIPFGPGSRSFGHPGAGGSIAFADPERALGFGYVMNQMSPAIGGGMHGFALMQTLFACLGERSRADS